MEEIASNIFVETNYPGVNVGVVATKEGLICVDAPPCPADAQEWVTRLRGTFDAPIRFLILTDCHVDRAINASAFGARVIAHQETHARLKGYAAQFPAPLVEGISTRYSLAREELDSAPVVLPQITFCNQATIILGDRQLIVSHFPSATHGSLWVSSEEEQVLFVGDTIVVDSHPFLGEADSKAWLDALVHLRRKRFRVQVLVPGRGPLCEKSATEPVSAYIRLVRRRVHALHRAGRPRADTTSLIPGFIDRFPHDDVPMEWLQKHLKISLDHIYDEYKEVEAATLPES